MKMTIDGVQVEIFENDKTLLEVAGRYDIHIPSPCYLAKRKHGCCKGCVVEVDGEQKYACVTTPEKGMQVVVDREDLNQLRKERIAVYSNAKNDPAAQCTCDCTEVGDCSSTSACC